MKKALALALLVPLAVGCARLPADPGVVFVYFREDPLNHRTQEVIEQVEILTPSADIRLSGKMPADWTASVRRQRGEPAACVLSCIHQQFAVSDIHNLDGVVGLAVPAKEAAEIEVRLTVTRGFFGPGRTIMLHAKDLVLK